MALNGVLGGLVGITAGCAVLTPGFAILTGLVAGVIVVYATIAIERIADDPVGAVTVHGVCGVWGTLAPALFNPGGFSLAQVGVQLLGIGAGDATDTRRLRLKGFFAVRIRTGVAQGTAYISFPVRSGVVLFNNDIPFFSRK